VFGAPDYAAEFIHPTSKSTVTAADALLADAAAG
jgi:hypothetical protein